MSEEAHELLKALLKISAQKRATADEALMYAYCVHSVLDESSKTDAIDLEVDTYSKTMKSHV